MEIEAVTINDTFHEYSLETNNILESRIYYRCLYVKYKGPTLHTRKYRKTKQGLWERVYKWSDSPIQLPEES